jgi:hypothetical protein
VFGTVTEFLFFCSGAGSTVFLLILGVVSILGQAKMDEKVNAVKKSAEFAPPPLKFGELTLFLSVRALKHAEFRSFWFRDLRDADLLA